MIGDIDASRIVGKDPIQLKWAADDLRMLTDTLNTGENVFIAGSEAQRIGRASEQVMGYLSVASEAVAENEKLRDENTELQAENEWLRAELAGETDKYQVLALRYDNLTARYEGLGARLEQTTADLDLKDTFIESLTEMICEVTGQLGQIRTVGDKPTVIDDIVKLLSDTVNTAEDRPDTNPK